MRVPSPPCEGEVELIVDAELPPPSLERRTAPFEVALKGLEAGAESREEYSGAFRLPGTAKKGEEEAAAEEVDGGLGGAPVRERRAAARSMKAGFGEVEAPLGAAEVELERGAFAEAGLRNCSFNPCILSLRSCSFCALVLVT